MSIKQNDMYETKDNNIANETNNEENDIIPRHHGDADGARHNKGAKL